MVLSCIISELKRHTGQKIAIFSYPLAFDARIRGVPVAVLPPRLVRKNYNGGAIQRRKNFDNMFSRFNRIPACDGRTDRRYQHV